MSYVQAVKLHSPLCHLARVLSAKTSSLHSTLQRGLSALTFASSLQGAGTLAANLLLGQAPRGGRCVCLVFVRVTAMRSLPLTTLPTVCVAGVSY